MKWHTTPPLPRVASVTSEGGRNKVMFQEPLSHAAVGTWIKAGDLRWEVTNIYLLVQPLIINIYLLVAQLYIRYVIR